MSRYLVERSFPDGLEIPVGDGGAEICREVVERNSDHGVTWVHSYVSADNAVTDESSAGTLNSHIKRRSSNMPLKVKCSLRPTASVRRNPAPMIAEYTGTLRSPSAAAVIVPSRNASSVVMDTGMPMREWGEN